MIEGLNNKILKLAPKYTAKSNAPATFQELLAFHSSSLIIWDGASDHTIYSDANVNHAFRAWHDSLHIKLAAPFTLEGEKIVALEQARLIDSDYYARIILAEVVGQAEYFAKHCKFPDNQVEFINNLLKVA